MVLPSRPLLITCPASSNPNNVAFAKTINPGTGCCADKRGLYMLARAGFPIDNEGRFCLRWPVNIHHAIANSFNAVHPVNAQRLASITRVVNEIKFKQAARKPNYALRYVRTTL